MLRHAVQRVKGQCSGSRRGRGSSSSSKGKGEGLSDSSCSCNSSSSSSSSVVHPPPQHPARPLLLSHKHMAVSTAAAGAALAPPSPCLGLCAALPAQLPAHASSSAGQQRQRAKHPPCYGPRAVQRWATVTARPWGCQRAGHCSHNQCPCLQAHAPRQGLGGAATGQSHGRECGAEGGAGAGADGAGASAAAAAGSTALCHCAIHCTADGGSALLHGSNWASSASWRREDGHCHLQHHPHTHTAAALRQPGQGKSPERGPTGGA